MVKRFHDPGDWMQSPTGEYVLASDYDAVAARLAEAERLLQQFAECDLNEGNCASLEIANRRIRNLARRYFQRWLSN